MFEEQPRLTALVETKVSTNQQSSYSADDGCTSFPMLQISALFTRAHLHGWEGSLLSRHIKFLTSLLELQTKVQLFR